MVKLIKHFTKFMQGKSKNNTQNNFTANISFNNIKCACCNNDRFYSISETSFFKKMVKECNKCGYKFTEITSKDAEIFLKNFYLKDYWEWRKKRIQFLHKLYKKFLNFDFYDARGVSQYRYTNPTLASEVLEIGSGNGNTAYQFFIRSHKITVIEPDQNNINQILLKMPNIEIFHGMLETFESKKTYDVILLSHVLEHSYDIRNFLLKAKKLLKPEGVIFIEVPDCENLNILRWSIMSHPHISHFTEESLKQLVKKINMKIIKSNSVRYIFNNKLHFLFRVLKFKFIGSDFYYETTFSKGSSIRLIITSNNF